jgi:hypothetical protein
MLRLPKLIFSLTKKKFSESKFLLLPKWTNVPVVIAVFLTNDDGWGYHTPTLLGIGAYNRHFMSPENLHTFTNFLETFS